MRGNETCTYRDNMSKSNVFCNRFIILKSNLHIFNCDNPKTDGCLKHSFIYHTFNYNITNQTQAIFKYVAHKYKYFLIYTHNTHR